MLKLGSFAELFNCTHIHERTKNTAHWSPQSHEPILTTDCAEHIVQGLTQDLQESLYLEVLAQTRQQSEAAPFN